MTRTRRGHGEGCLSLRKDGRWSAVISLGGGLRKTSSRKTREEALLALQQAQRAKMQGTLNSTREETVEAFLLKWLAYQIQPKVRERTYQTYQQVVKQDILPSLGNRALQKLTHWHLQRLYQQKRHQKASPSTIRKIHRIFCQALRDAVKLGHVSHNVGQFVELPPEKKQLKVGRALRAEEARRFLAVVKGDPLEALYVLALTTGMRQGELLALQWRDLDLTLGKLQVQRTLIRVYQGQAIVAVPKSPTSRRCVQLTPLAVTALQTHAQRLKTTRQREGSSGHVPAWVFSDDKGVPFRASRVVRQSFQPLVAKAGFPPIRFHDLRHSAATLLLTLEIHPKIVQELLGHSQIGVTMDIYSHALPSLQEGAMQKLHVLLTSSDTGETKQPGQRLR